MMLAGRRILLWLVRGRVILSLVVLWRVLWIMAIRVIMLLRLCVVRVSVRVMCLSIWRLRLWMARFLMNCRVVIRRCMLMCRLCVLSNLPERWFIGVPLMLGLSGVLLILVRILLALGLSISVGLVNVCR